MGAAAKDMQTRAAQRVNTLLVAEALVGNARWPVKIRNISQFGAMLESPTRLDLKTSVVISRGSLRAAGEVVWSRDKSVGMRFFEATNVEEWIGVSTSDAAASFQTSGRLEDHFSNPLTDEIAAIRISEELDYVARMTSSVSAMLSDDPILRVRHCGRIQELVMAADMLHQLAAVIVSDDKFGAVETRVTGPMRQRMLR